MATGNRLPWICSLCGYRYKAAVRRFSAKLYERIPGGLNYHPRVTKEDRHHVCSDCADKVLEGQYSRDANGQWRTYDLVQ